MIGSIVGFGALVGVGWIVGWREHPARESARIANKLLSMVFFIISRWPALSL
jgi:hypothetical protein